MSKEEILKEYSKKFSIANFTWTGELDAIKSRKILKSFLSQAIDKTREETIREIEDGLPKEMEAFYTGNLMADVLENDEKKVFNKCLREIKQSLINLRKKK